MYYIHANLFSGPYLVLQRARALARLESFRVRIQYILIHVTKSRRASPSLGTSGNGPTNRESSQKQPRSDDAGGSPLGDGRRRRSASRLSADIGPTSRAAAVFLRIGRSSRHYDDGFGQGRVLARTRLRQSGDVRIDRFESRANSSHASVAFVHSSRLREKR